MGKEAGQWWKISVFHWCKLAIHSYSNAYSLDSDSSYTWKALQWRFEVLSAMKQAWQNNGDGNMHRAGLCSLHFTLINPSSLDINENNRAYSETDAPSPIICQALFTISAFWLVFIFQFLLDRVPPFHWITKKVIEIVGVLQSTMCLSATLQTQSQVQTHKCWCKDYCVTVRWQ